MELLKNIYTFANILSAANTEVVKSWDLSTFTKAVKWAGYCKKVEKNTRNSIFRGDLDRQIKLMTVMLTPTSLLLLSVDKLREAPYLLNKSLIHNPFTPVDIRKEAEINCCAGEQIISSIQSEQMQSEYRVHQLLGEDVSFIEQSYYSQAVHVVERLVSLQKICISRQNRYNQFLESTIRQLGKCVCGWNVIIHMILIDDNNEEDREVTMGIRKKILNIVTNMATDFNCGIWSCAYSLLLDVSTLDDCFADIYSKYLISWAEDMVPVYGWQDNGDMYFWRHKYSQMVSRFSYTKLQECVLGIYLNDAILKRKMVRVILEKSELSCFNIYKDLIRNCLDILALTTHFP